MAHWVITHQNEDGSWAGGISETAWGLRCLAEFRSGPAFAKLQYAPGIHNSAWNERPSDVRNFTAYLGYYCYCATPQRWELFNLSQPLGDLLDMPVLFVSGNNELDFDEAQIKKLRAFVEHSGLILGNADCGNAAFAASFRTLGRTLFPHYAFRELPQSHVIFSDEMFHARKWRKHPVVEGMSNGIRELLILIPQADFSLAWQHVARKTQVESFQLAANIHLYATDKEANLSYAGAIAPASKSNRPRRSIRVARLQVGDNWNPEPRAWPRMAEFMELNCNVKLVSEAVKPDPAHMIGFNVAHLTGTTAFSLTPTERDELKSFVNNGGVLLIDAAGGSTEFADAAQKELKLVFGDPAKELDSAIGLDALKSKQAGYVPIERIEYRNYARNLINGSVHVSHLRAMHWNGRVAVVFSREDLTAGMAAIHSDGINGYKASTASAIVRNLLLYAMGPV
ncbi:MAG TPA: DUF4159 domain-containing protein [Tepidisphaeraceae bacterium]|jgi:hypothetical protein|nr:DUF4159 domain-containing protein [Tepidisphaeraceae bacterium]